MENQTTLILGANSDIAKSLATEIITENQSSLIVVCRDTSFYQQERFSATKVIKVIDYNEAEIQGAVNEINKSSNSVISRVFICHGLLHSETCQPEKRLEDFSVDAFKEVIMANTITPMLWLKFLTPILTGKSPCKIIIFNARVGSISENKLGGWYSYRTSKAAMNMLIKTAAVELARRAKNIKLISFHPGTTDTRLSKSFQKNVPENKLFTPQFVAVSLLEIVKDANVDGQPSYLDWQGKTISW